MMVQVPVVVATGYQRESRRIGNRPQNFPGGQVEAVDVLQEVVNWHGGGDPLRRSL